MIPYTADDFPVPPRPPSRVTVDAGPCPSHRGLRHAVVRALDQGGVARYRWGRLHGLSATQVSRALDPARGDGVQLAAVARAVGYVPHPSMHGHYRRAGVVDAVAPVLLDDEDDGLDPESRAERDHARYERLDHEASHCLDDRDDDARADDWLSSEDAAPVAAEARAEVERAESEAEQDRAWAAYEAMLDPEDWPGHPSNQAELEETV